MLVEKKNAQGKFNPIKSRTDPPYISQNTQLTKLYVFHYDSVPRKFLGWFLEFVKVVSWSGGVYAMAIKACLYVYVYVECSCSYEGFG